MGLRVGGLALQRLGALIRGLSCVVSEVLTETETIILILRHLGFACWLLVIREGGNEKDSGNCVGFRAAQALNLDA